ncbi:hypothetical protein L1987_72108 [Smallanthus sonchifolius]|uniref:Uncharacterized protein n=1 Tax=Smallanthus sonchifolius TaxID=185202 RepID=A0ACB9AYP0_9ASTR|nr:hypothetical protein L1987_72108 [Smallanthus sonchifolius]
MPSRASFFLAYYPCSLINKTSLVLLFCLCSLVIFLFSHSPVIIGDILLGGALDRVCESSMSSVRACYWLRAFALGCAVIKIDLHRQFGIKVTYFTSTAISFDLIA